MKIKFRAGKLMECFCILPSLHLIWILLSDVQNALLGKDCHNRFTDFMWDLKKLKEGNI